MGQMERYRKMEDAYVKSMMENRPADILGAVAPLEPSPVDEAPPQQKLTPIELLFQKRN